MEPSFSVGAFTFHVYGFLLGVAVVVGYEVARRVARRHRMNEKALETLFWWALVSGLMGARLYHVIDYWDYYSTHWVEVVKVWHGGVGIFGAVLGGMLGVYVGNRLIGEKQMAWGALLDTGAMGLPLAQAIGRLGNYFNQELYGLPTTLPWGIMIGGRPGRYQPLFAYETGLLALLFGGLWWLERTKRLPWGEGAYMAVYAVGYGTIRFLLEYLRIEPWQAGPLTVGQWMSLGFVGLGVWKLGSVVGQETKKRRDG